MASASVEIRRLDKEGVKDEGGDAWEEDVESLVEEHNMC